MKAINSSAFRKRMKEHLDELANTDEPLLVMSPERQVVVVSKKQFDKLVKGVSNE
jgi:PHD/YefM family antitoxin component YafN of YafNO toxin-antitoxin module